MVHAMMNYGWSKSFSYHCSTANVGGSVFLNLMSVVLAFMYLTVGPNQYEVQTYFFIAFPCYLISALLMRRIDFIDEDKFYEELDYKYKNEKYRVFKGVLVFLYYFLSVIGFTILCILVLISQSSPFQSL